MRLTPHDIAKMLDHSTLQPFLTDEDIRKGCELALRYDTASVCARPCDMPLVASLLRGSDVKVCTVIGFPHGTHRTAIKVAEAKQALADGCTELDMVINIGKLLGGDEDYVRDEIRQIVQVRAGQGLRRNSGSGYGAFRPGGGRHALRGQRDSGHHGGGGEALRGGNPSGSGYAQGHGRRLLSGKHPEQDAVPCPGRMNAHHQSLHL